MIPTLPRADALRLTLIRSAMLLGLLTFGGATWFQHRNGHPTPIPAEQARTFSYVFAGLALMAVAALFMLRKRLERAIEMKQQLTLYIAGYGIAEGAALFGGATWFVGGDGNLFVAGLILMVVAFQILPIKRQT
jgi:hypothetical protein